MPDKISVVTICFNNLEDVIRTCASVDEQTVKPFEHWIINGSSTDDIKMWLNENPQPQYRKWISERDKGIADAFNKGIKHSSGDIIHLLNSGDLYADKNAIGSVIQAFQGHSSVNWLSGKIRLLRGGHWVEVGKPFEKSKLYRGMRSVSHPTWFVRKIVYDKVGGYSSDYKIAMDYDMMCRIADEPYYYLDQTLAAFDPTGISSENYLESLGESKRVYESHFGTSLKLSLWQIRLKTLYYLMKSPVGKSLYTIKKKLGLANA